MPITTETTHQIQQRLNIPAPFFVAAIKDGRLPAKETKKGTRSIYLIARPDLEHFLQSELAGPHQLMPIEVPIDELVLDRRFNFRAETYADIVDDYVLKLEQGVTLPAITACHLDRSYIIDGGHTWEAHRRVGKKTIQSIVITGLHEDEMIALALRKNCEHGQPRTPADKRTALASVIQHPLYLGKSTRELAEICGMSHMTVQRFRQTLGEPKIGGGSDQKKVALSTHQVALRAIEKGLAMLEQAHPRIITQIRAALLELKSEQPNA